MNNNLNYNDDYSIEYRTRLSEALAESKRLDFARPSFVSPTAPVLDDVLSHVSRMINQFSGYLDVIVPGYWGNSCQTLSTNIFAFLNANDVPAEIVIGNVIINGTDEFSTTLETVCDEFLSEVPKSGVQAIHAWVSIGDDTIIDAALPPRLGKYYTNDSRLDDQIFIGRASYLSAAYRTRYQPIVVGSEFFAKTNPPDPMNLLRAWLQAK